MFKSGDRILFRADTRSHNGDFQEFFLRFFEKDENGLLMLGEMPSLQFIHQGQAVGPIIFDDDYRYRVQKVDDRRKMVWLVDLN